VTEGIVWLLLAVGAVLLLHRGNRPTHRVRAWYTEGEL
jgi:hypothetical protein